MSDGSLSQDEIDALLQGTDTIEMEATAGAATASGLSDELKDAFQNLLRELVESQSSNLSMLTGKSVRIDAPTTEVVTREQLLADLPDELVEVKIDFILAYSAQIFKLMEDENLIKQYNQPQDFVLECMNLLFYGIVTDNE